MNSNIDYRNEYNSVVLAFFSNSFVIILLFYILFLNQNLFYKFILFI